MNDVIDDVIEATGTDGAYRRPGRRRTLKDVVSETVPTSFTARFYNGAGLAAQGTLQFGHLFTDTPR